MISSSALSSLLSHANSMAEPDKKSKLQKTTQDFSSVFLGKAVESILPEEEGEDAASFGGGMANETYRTLFSQELGKILSKNGTLAPLDSAMRKQLLSMQASHA